MKKSSAMDRLLEEGFFDSREAALPYLMSGAVYCGAQPVSNGGQLVPLDKPMTVRGLYDLWVDAAEDAYAEVALSDEFRAYAQDTSLSRLALVNNNNRIERGEESQV